MSNKEYNPQMHTVEHLLNGTISSMLGCSRAFSTHIEKKKSKIDFRYTRNLTSEELTEAEQKVNEIIALNVPVTTETIPTSEAAEKYNLSRLPDKGMEKVRIVRVGEYDACPCIGEHVASTSEIDGKLKIISSDYREETGGLRLRFKIVQQ